MTIEWIFVLVLSIIVVIVVSVGFLLVALNLSTTLTQLKSLMVDVEKTSTEARGLVRNLNSVSLKVDNDLEKVDAMIEASKEAVEVVKNSVKFINKNLIKNSAGLLALIPAIKFGWNLVKKFKGGDHE